MSAWRPLNGWLIDGLGDEPAVPYRCIHCGTGDSPAWWVGYRYGNAQWYWRQDTCNDCQMAGWVIRHERRQQRRHRRIPPSSSAPTGGV